MSSKSGELLADSSSAHAVHASILCHEHGTFSQFWGSGGTILVGSRRVHHLLTAKRVTSPDTNMERLAPSLQDFQVSENELNSLK
jgi:hypothetical protein